jgi:hypothetical protein
MVVPVLPCAELPWKEAPQVNLMRMRWVQGLILYLSHALAAVAHQLVLQCVLPQLLLLAEDVGRLLGLGTLGCQCLIHDVQVKMNWRMLWSYETAEGATAPPLNVASGCKQRC